MWGNHLGRSKSLSGSAFRRNVAQHLGIGTPSEIKVGKVQLSEAQLDQVRVWIMGCRVAWLTCSTEDEAIALESSLKDEHKPPLTKI